MFVDPDCLKFGRVDQLAGPGLVRPLGKYGEVLLLTEGEEGRAISLSEGEHGGWFMLISEGGNHEGLCIGGVAIEVDVGSAFSPNAVGRPILSVIRHKGGLAIVGRPERGTYGRMPYIPWQGDAVEQQDNELVGFASWDVVIYRGDERIVLHEQRCPLPADN